MIKGKHLFLILLTGLFVSALCLGLYYVDNKYTRTGPQPISGVLFYEQETRLYYLTRQWVLYPGVLLTPDTVQKYSGYRTYGDIGGKNPTVAGGMTYRLTMMLPKTQREYALELSEVFSACKLYVNGRLLLQLGDPEPKTYQEGLASQIVTFTASGQTELLLVANDHSGLTGGLTYPPAFGDVDVVMTMREGRLLLHGAGVLVSLLGMLLTVTFGLKGGQRRRGIGTSLLCLSLVVVTGYPLYHGLFVTPVQPWYTLEPTCYYAILLLSLFLYGEICGLTPRHTWLLSAPCIVGLLFTLVRFGAASILPPAAAQIFSAASDGIKYYTAVCLLILSAWALWREKTHSLLLLCGAVSLAVCLIWDRLLPLYEPIIGGWFGETGGVLLVFSLGSVLWLDAAEAYRFRLSYAESVHRMEQRLAMQREHYSQLSSQIRLAREAGHDLRHHMRTLRGLSEQGQWERLSAYLREYEPHVQERELQVWSDHPAADAVLSHYAKLARELNAVYDVRFSAPPDLPFPDDELCIILGNLLENAVEAISRQRHGARRLYLRGDVTDGQLRLVVDNSFDGTIRQRDGIWISAKHPGPGLGLSSVATIAEKYGGLTDFYGAQGMFHASVLIPL